MHLDVAGHVLLDGSKGGGSEEVWRMVSINAYISGSSIVANMLFARPHIDGYSHTKERYKRLGSLEELGCSNLVVRIDWHILKVPLYLVKEGGHGV